MKNLIKSNVPILTFFSRFWLLTLFAVLLNCVPLWSKAWFYVPIGKDEWGNIVWEGQTTFQILGSIAYIPGVVLAAYWINAFAIHLYFRKTVDLDAHNNTYSDAWGRLADRDLVLFTVILRVGLFIGASLIVAAVVK